MRGKSVFVRLTLAAAMFGAASAAQAVVEIQFWHSMEQKLGERVDEIAKGFNASQKDYKIVPVYKGNYEQSMAAGIAAFRGGNAPHILQVYEVGTATMMAAKGAIKPIHQLSKETGVAIDPKNFIPAVASYYSDDNGLVSMPFNSSTPVMYWNRDAFKKAGLPTDAPPKTWKDVANAAKKLKASGMNCGFTTAWQAWIQLENGTSWHALPFATKNNGFDGLDAKLEFNVPTMVNHITFLQNMQKEGSFTYGGRKDDAVSRFYTGDCGITMSSSGSLGNIKPNAKFDFGVAAMPYHDDVPGAPQNALIGGASLWVMGGKKADEYKGVAEFFKYLASPKVMAKWHQDTGYLPVTLASYEETKASGFYDKNPTAEIAVKQMQNKPPLPFTRGLRLGNLPQIRIVIDEELEGVWNGTQSPKQALDKAVERGNELLRKFEKTAK